MNDQQRRDNRMVEAVRRWAAGPDAEQEERLAWEAIGWNPGRWMGEAWCGAWASLVDAVNGGPSPKYNRVMASSCDRRCGAGPAGSWGSLYDPKRIRGEDGGKVAAAGLLAAGDIVTVGESGDPWGAHVTTAVAVVEGGVWCAGGNQGGHPFDRSAPRVRGGVALTLYPWSELRMLVTPPGREYTSPAEWCGPKAVLAARGLLAPWVEGGLG